MKTYGTTQKSANERLKRLHKEKLEARKIERLRLKSAPTVLQVSQLALDSMTLTDLSGLFVYIQHQVMDAMTRYVDTQDSTEVNAAMLRLYALRAVVNARKR